MFIDKNIEAYKYRKNTQSTADIEDLQTASIKHIRSISTELTDLLNQIQDYESSMASPDASPINKKYKSGTSNKTQSKQDHLLDLTLFRKKRKETEKEQVTKKTYGSVHYTTYMKPIHHVKEKIKEILEEQKKQKEIEEQRERILFQKMKKKSLKNYESVSPRYHKYDDRKLQKTEAIANRTMEKQFEQMQGVTFSPKINNNVEISQSFKERLLNNEYKKSRKQAEIIRDVLKEQTHKPKINSHVQSESKIKTIWLQSPKASNKNSTAININQSFAEFSKHIAYEPEQQFNHSSSRGIKTNISQFGFMIEKRLFEH